MGPEKFTELGAVLHENGRCDFCVWAPHADQVTLHLLEPQMTTVKLVRDHKGYHRASVADVAPATWYYYQLDDGLTRPDPASRSQPQGVHGPSQVISSDYAWSDGNWSGIPLEDYIFYEVHVGTFTPEGTFAAIIPQLDRLKQLGITALEIMPVAEFPGARGWGYDGVCLYAPHHAYGGPEGLKQLVDACHQRELAVVLDVVYNHLGPEGNYLADFGPYFTTRYHTPWGMGMNLDGPYSDPVRAYFIENALYWITEFHIDALRLDATHALLDFSAYTFLEELVEEVHQQAIRFSRQVFLIAENDRSDDRLLRSREQGGYGLDAQWSDELHHVLHTLLTGERFGYYSDFGQFTQLTTALQRGFVYAGEYSPFRQRRHGSFCSDLAGKRFVVCLQNHDQIGNRMNGDRLSHLVTFDELKLGAAIVLLSPYLPLLFMGEEYAETATFPYFTSFEDPELGKAVSEGRRNEFKEHGWDSEAPDPQAAETFLSAKLTADLWQEGYHRVLHDFYTELIRLRKTLSSLRHLNKDHLNVVGYDREHVVFMHRWHEDHQVISVFSFNDHPVSLSLPVPRGKWRSVLHSADPQWQVSTADKKPEPIPDWDETSHAELTLNPKSVLVLVKI